MNERALKHAPPHHNSLPTTLFIQKTIIKLSVLSKVYKWRNEESSKINCNRQYTDTGYAQSILNFQTRKSKTAATINYMQQHNAELNINTKTIKSNSDTLFRNLPPPLKKPLLNLSWRLRYLVLVNQTPRQTDHFQNFYKKSIFHWLIKISVGPWVEMRENVNFSNYFIHLCLIYDVVFGLWTINCI